MIVITNPDAIVNEINIIDSLLEEGLSLLHIRKPGFSAIEMGQFIHQIQLKFRANLVLHTHHELAEDFGITKIHFSESGRKNTLDLPAKFSKPCRYKSTSTHCIENFNMLENFDYAFLSPVFKSISKENYFPKKDHFESLRFRTNTTTKIVALGGIDVENIEVTLKNGFDDIALLGAIWNNDNPLKKFKSCQRIVHSSLV
ncbi:thiamine phosphate synthase [Flavobacterium hercynium]|uniref:Thiamine phosphate synthase n=1 Tax=Flavobacterium hercynium TaxID=387094 RepID=A0A226HPR1_9FLAO|nr:thiamine phosphate synthase [Flavobacterium hercynium]OXA96309.1 thiamine phosphate synthase [Flavobacterium hercynium]SMP04189.1 thiamine-phosphate pyrophosphorylase [Flavobacterium hercynium]